VRSEGAHEIWNFEI